MTRGLFRLMFLVVSLAAIALLAAAITMRVAIHGAEVHVPPVTNLTVYDATGAADRAGLKLVVADRLYSAQVPIGRVIDQTPAAGTTVRRDWTMRVVESLGPQTVSIPNVLGMDEHTATQAIQAAHLDVGNVGTIPRAGVKPGTVVAQDPAAGAQGVDQPRVSILLAEQVAERDSGFLMPSFIGVRFSQAAATVAGAGLKLANPVPADTSDPSLASARGAVPASANGGTILTQRPAAGSHVTRGETVVFTVSP